MFDDLKEAIVNSGLRLGPGGEGIDAEVISEAEKELCFALPPSYRWFLEEYRFAEAAEFMFYPLETEFGVIDIVALHRERVDGGAPPQELLFCEGGDEEFYFDTSMVDASGEFAVCRRELGAGDDEQYAVSFARFLLRFLGEYKVLWAAT